MATLSMQRAHTPLKRVLPKREGFPSLFQPDSDDELSSDSGSEREYQQAQPTTLPMNEVIVVTPKSLTSLLELLLPRLQPSAEVKGVSLPDQKSLMDVLVGELASQFSIIQHQIDDPFLNPIQNQNLHRRVVVRVCEIIEELHKQFLVKAAAVRGDGVFSAAANISRVRAELTLEANKRLNIPLIRRDILTEIRGALPSIDTGAQVTIRKRINPQRLPPIPKQKVKRRAARKLSLDDLRLGEPLESKLMGFGVRLDSDAVRRRVNKLYARVPDPVTDEGHNETALTWDGVPSPPETRRNSAHQPSAAPRLHRVESTPELWGAFLLCDMGLTSRTDRPSDKRGEERLLGIHRPPSVGNFMDLKLSERGDSAHTEPKQLENYTSQDLSRDLQDLCQSPASLDQSGVDELHPLLQAHGHGLSVRGARRLALFEAELRRREEGSARDEQGESETLESRIPSVATLDQLPYLSIDHLEGPPSSSHPSLHVKSGPSLIDSQSHSLTGPPDPSQLLTDLGGSLERSSLGQSELKLADTTPMLLPSDPDLLSGGSACALDESNSRVSRSRVVSARSQSVMEEGSGQGSMWAGSDYLMEDLDDLALPQETNDNKPIPSPPSPDPVPQSAFITTRTGNGSVVRTADVQVSERTPLNELKLKPFGPIYNQITGELDSQMMAELDSSLHEGDEIREVYQEIMKTLSTNHLLFTHEPTLEPAINAPVDLSRILASHTLHHRRNRRVVNRELYRPVPHPWGKDTSRKDWERSNQYQGTHLEQHGISLSAGVSRSPRLTSKAYSTWASWWSSTANSEDYLKYASRKESDYLRLVYHLYDSDGSDSEAEEEARLKREKLELLHRKLKAKEARRRQRYSAKSHYEAGVWNVNTVMMGGLGGDPDGSSDEGELESSIASQEQMVVTHEEAQKRLGMIWQKLLLPHSLQMDMAIKYSNPRLSAQLAKVLRLWEEVCALIEQRELVLSGLETFEREASDPSRFFSKSNRGSSSTRLQEARKRDSLHKEIDSLDKKVSFIIQQLRKKFGDIVTYKGRPYCEKMSHDRTEMLYWLQQERRAAVLKPASVALYVNSPVVVHVPTP